MKIDVLMFDHESHFQRTDQMDFRADGLPCGNNPALLNDFPGFFLFGFRLLQKIRHERLPFL